MFKSLIIINKPIDKFNFSQSRTYTGGIFAFLKKWMTAVAEYGKNTTGNPAKDGGKAV